jgi:hypothetical protein
MSHQAMRLVFEHIDFTMVGHMQTILEAEGIRTDLRNAGSAGLAGEVPYTQVYPELWVMDNTEEPRARAIIREFREKDAGTPPSPDWKCPSCGEVVEGVFTRCWNCETEAPSEQAGA